MLDQRAIYVISVAGVALDALGGLYRGYDLFGRRARHTGKTHEGGHIWSICGLRLWSAVRTVVRVDWQACAGTESGGRIFDAPTRHTAPRICIVSRPGRFSLGLAGALSVNTPFGVRFGLAAAGFLGIAQAIDPQPLRMLGIKPT